MADETDGLASRPPRVEDLQRICESLEREGAEYVLIGGFAVILHGFVRATKDIDLLIDSSPANVARVKKALSILEDDAAAEVDDEDIAKYAVVRVADEVIVDLMKAACGISYDDAMASGDVDHFELGEQTIPVAGKALLIRMKDTVRPSDAADVEYLRLRLEED